MKKIILGLAVLAALYPFVRDALRSEEERILLLVDEAIRSFDEGSVRGVVAPLAADFELARPRMGREDLRGVMLLLSREARDEGGFRLRARRDRERTTIERTGARATLRTEMELVSEPGGGGRELLWRFEIELALEDRDGWTITAARIETLEGRPRY